MFKIFVSVFGKNFKGPHLFTAMFLSLSVMCIEVGQYLPAMLFGFMGLVSLVVTTMFAYEKAKCIHKAKKHTEAHEHYSK